MNDLGTQFGILLVGWKTRLDQDALAADPIDCQQLRQRPILNLVCAEFTAKSLAKIHLAKWWQG